MGVSGAGKTAIGERLAARFGWGFFDGDDFHSAANVSKMASGQPLTDADRAPWLASIHRRILDLEATGSNAVIACSALKQSYRQQLLADTSRTEIVYLRGARELIERRLRQRQDHYFDVALLASQFVTLEEPEDVLVVDIDGDPEAVTEAVLEALRSKASGESEEERQ